MTVQRRGGAMLAGVVCALFLFGCGSVRAGVLDLRDAARREPSVIHQYTFAKPLTGPNSMRLSDRVGSLHLKEWARTSPTNLVYEQGYDAWSTGGSTVYVPGNINRGAAWASTSSIALPPALTIECLFCPRQVPNTECYVLSTKDGENRGYFLRQNSDTNLSTRVGGQSTGFRTIVKNYSTGHWYYVVNTYSVSGGTTTINSYYADLTGDGVLRQAITNALESGGSYGSSAILGVGCLFTGDYQYPAAGMIDEVALYNTVLSAERIGLHLAELRRATPVVEYRELFPNDTNAAARWFPQEGWKAHCGTSGVHSTSVVLEEFNTAFDADVPAVASFPQDTGVTQGYLNNHAGPTNVNYLYWTEEMADRLDVGWIKRIGFDSRSDANRTLRAVLRVDTNATPGEVADDAWFVGADFDNAPGVSALAIPATFATWRSNAFDLAFGEWAALTFDPGLQLARGDSEVALPTNGLVTAFGLLQDTHDFKVNMRLDNFTIYASRVYPPPPPRGTFIMLQ